MEHSLELLSFGDKGWGDELLLGVGLTLSLAIATLPLGLLLGFLIALCKLSREKTLRIAANIYTTIFRGLPELLTLFLVYYGGQILLTQLVITLGIAKSVEVNAFVAGMFALGVVFSSYASEVFQSAFRSIPQGQYEGSYAIGLTRYQTMRFVIFPQLIRLALPGLSNIWLILLKDTALVSILGLTDIMRQSRVAAQVSKEPFLFYSLACLLYLVLAMLSSIAIQRIENWSSRGDIKQ